MQIQIDALRRDLINLYVVLAGIMIMAILYYLAWGV